LGSLREACDANDRDFAEIEITCMWPGIGGTEAVQALADVGVSRLVVPVMGLPDPMEAMQKISEEIIHA